MATRVLSGTRPTGKLHLGNYLGAVDNWRKYQSEDSFYMIADWHAMTTEYDSKVRIKDNVREIILDYLSTGLDPEKCTIFVQSDVPAHAELSLMLSMITPISWLERNPTYKELMSELKGKDLRTHGFLGYPVLQAADILLYDADLVPVGEDQLPHIELTREIARRFNHLYGETFKEPKESLTETKKLPGLDGRKMSKSYKNCIYISDSAEDVEKKVRSMKTDPGRQRRDDKGNPDVCTVCFYHDLLNKDRVEAIKADCREATIGCVDCKKECAAVMNAFLEPMRERRKYYEDNYSKVEEILKSGAEKANEAANATLNRAREAVGI